MADDALNAAKAAMRLSARTLRDALKLDPTRAADAAADLFVGGIELPVGATISAYWPIGSELDPRPLLARLHAKELPLALPVVETRGKPLLFRRWRPDDALIPGGFGTSIPGPTADPVVPDVLIVPLLAFDGDGYRLGYGGGYYDRTLAALRRGGGPVMAVGFAYEAQQVDTVPRHDGDARLDALVSEQRYRRF